MTGAYAAHNTFIAQALAAPSLRKTILGFALIEIIYSVSVGAFEISLAWLSPNFSDAMVWGNTWGGMFVQLLAFGVLGVAVMIIAQLINGRPRGHIIVGLIGPEIFATSQFLKALAYICITLVGLELLPPYWAPDTIDELRSPSHWVLLLPLSLFALLVQTGAEEVFYRGYLQQQFAARFSHPAIWLVVPNLLFAAAHWDTSLPLIGNAEYLIWAFFFGLAASDLTARSGTLGPAIAFHLANNGYAFLFFGETAAPDSGFALLLFLPSDIMSSVFGDNDSFLVMFTPLIAQLGLILIMWATARFALRR